MCRHIVVGKVKATDKILKLVIIGIFTYNKNEYLNNQIFPHGGPSCL
jgi:hypothetical protein